MYFDLTASPQIVWVVVWGIAGNRGPDKKTCSWCYEYVDQMAQRTLFKRKFSVLNTLLTLSQRRFPPEQLYVRMGGDGGGIVEYRLKKYERLCGVKNVGCELCFMK